MVKQAMTPRQQTLHTQSSNLLMQEVRQWLNKFSLSCRHLIHRLSGQLQLAFLLAKMTQVLVLLPHTQKRACTKTEQQGTVRNLKDNRRG